MKDTLKKLEDIAEKLDAINDQMNDEERVWPKSLPIVSVSVLKVVTPLVITTNGWTSTGWDISRYLICHEEGRNLCPCIKHL